MKGIIYCAVSPSYKKYYGQTIEFDHRKRTHYLDAFKGNCQYAFHRALRKYGFDNFVWHIIESYVEDKDKLINILNDREIYWIKKDKTYLPEFGYNMKIGGFNGLLTEETKAKIGKANRGKHHTEETKQKQREANLGEKSPMYGKSFYDVWLEKYGKEIADQNFLKYKENLKGRFSGIKGKHLTEETKQKISEANTGKKHSKETKALWSLQRKGRKLSEETKQKIGEKHRGKKLSEETKKKIGEKNKINSADKNNGMYGKKHTQESKKKMSEKCKGKKHSEETKQKMSEAHKGKKYSKKIT